MKLKKLLLFCFLSFTIYSCSDDKEVPPFETPNTEAEEQIQGVIDALKEDADLSMFREALANVDVKKFADKEFTILAYKNQVASKATPSETDSIRQQETMRHIIGGRHTFEELSKLKKLIALSKDTLYIEYSESSKSISINGVLLGKSIVADKSIIFVTDEIVPQIEDTTSVKQEEYVFKVININPHWGKPNFSEGLDFVENALVTIYKGDEVIKELRTDAYGVARFTYKEDEELDYIVKTDTSSMIYQDYLVRGLFYSQEQIDTSPIQYNFKAVLGGLRFDDFNGDGIIDDKDKTDRDKVSNLTGNMFVFLVGKSYTFPKQEPEVTIDIDMAYDAYDEAITIFERLDNDYSTLTERQTISPTSKIVDTLWNSAYDAIQKINTVMDYNTTDAEDRLELEGFRANLHFHLSLIFGDVPLQLTNKIENIARNSQQEVYDFATTTYREILSKDSLSHRYQSTEYINSLLVYRLQKKYTDMYTLAKEGMESGTIMLQSDNRRSELNAIRVHLLLAEAANELGKLPEAIQYINRLLVADAKPALGGDTTTDILRTTIRNYYNEKNYEGIRYDYGIKYDNIASWSLNSTWGTYKLQPIPKSALTAFGNGTLLTQNPGY